MNIVICEDSISDRHKLENIVVQLSRQKSKLFIMN